MVFSQSGLKMKKESSFKDYKKHLKDLKKKGIVKNKKDEAKYWKKIASYLCAS